MLLAEQKNRNWANRKKKTIGLEGGLLKLDETAKDSTKRRKGEPRNSILASAKKSVSALYEEQAQLWCVVENRDGVSN